MNLLTGPLSPDFIARKAATYASTISEKSKTSTNCIGFIDGTVLRISRPGGSNNIQRAVYNGHKCTHALKYQAISTLDGLFLHGYGPCEGRQHDLTIYRRSRLTDILRDTLVVKGQQYHIYGDADYTRENWMKTPYQGSNLTLEQLYINGERATSRATVQSMFLESKRYWPRMDHKRSLRVGQDPVGNLYLVAMLLTNIRNCVYSNLISQYFQIQPPSFEEYLSHK